MFSTFLALLLISGPASAGIPAAETEEPLCQAQKSGRVQVGEELRISYRSPALSIDLRGLPPTKAMPLLVWSEEIYFPGASYIAPYFGHFELPQGASLVVRAPDGSRSWEYRGYGKADLGREKGFWGIHIPGDRAVLELFSNRPVAADAVVVDSFAHGYPVNTHDYSATKKLPCILEPLAGGKIVCEPPPPPPPPPPNPFPGEESLCGPDDSEWAKCYQTSEPTVYDRGRATARLLIQGTFACTGWLLGSAGHLMTNEHCIGSSSDALNTDYEFMAEGASCTTNCFNWFACPGTVVANSATLVQLDPALDYALTQLPTNPTGTYGYLQLRSTGAALGERIYIPQHPQAWGKRIGVFSTHSQNPGGFCEVDGSSEPVCSGGPGDVGYFCDTQGGSSGSAVLGYSDNLVVALHHCRGNPACTSTGGNANRGVPIPAIISDLGGNLPPDAIGGGVPAGYYRCVVDISGGTHTCDDGIVTVTYSSGSYRVAKIDLSDGYQSLDVLVDVCNPSSYVMHFADSPTCDGWGGDGATTVHNAESHVHGTAFYFWGVDVPSLSITDPAVLELGVLPASGCYQVQWSIQEDRLRFDDDGDTSDSARIDLTSFRSFEIAPYNEPDGEDPGGLDADLWYAGLNRTVGSSSRTGSGVTKACFVLSQSTAPDPAIISDLCAD
ncbi:MAG: serine protease [Thermoanaerobaculia bacterium]